MIKILTLFAVILPLIENIQTCTPMWDPIFEKNPIDQSTMCSMNTISGSLCILPFNYAGITYHTCTIRGPNNPNYRPQCAISVNANNTAVTWSFCVVPTDAVVSYITVRKNGASSYNEGSLQGGTMIWIYGQRFAVNAFTPLPSITTSNSVQLTDGYTVYDCEMHIEKISSTQLTCYTPVLTESIYQVRVYVNGFLVPLYQYIDPTRTLFIPLSSQTPTITGLTPVSTTPQSIFQLSGSFKTSCYSRDVEECIQDTDAMISRIFIGGHLCNLMDSNNGSTYATVSDTSLQCYFEGTEVGIFNVTLLVTNEYGRAAVHSSLYRVSPREDLYHIQTYPVINSVAPTVGSIVGGTLLTIRGNFFHDHPQYPLMVSIDEQPCAIIDSNQTTIHCQTSGIPIRSMNHSAGGRGLEIYRRSGVTTSQMILSSMNPPIPPNNAMPSWTDDALYISKTANAETVWLIGFVRPVKSATYTFVLDTNGAAALFLSPDENPTNKVLIATANQTQSSSMILLNDMLYYLFCVGSRSGGYLRLGIELRMLETRLTAGMSSAVFNEIQRIDVVSNITNEEQEIIYTSESIDGTAEIQSLQVGFSSFHIGFRDVYTGILIGQPSASALQMALNDLPTIYPLKVNVSMSDTSYLIEFPIEMGDVPLLVCLSDLIDPPNITEVIKGISPGTTIAFALDDQWTDHLNMTNRNLTENQLVSTFNRLFSIRCPPSISDARSTSSIVYLQDFETNCAYDETSITTQAFCGQCSYRGSTILTGNTKIGHILCFAYRILNQHVISMGLAVQINGNPSTTLWLTISFIPISDRQWHYTCLDVRSRLISQSSISSSVRLLLIQQAWLNYDIRKSIFLDTISIRTALPIGYSEEDLYPSTSQSIEGIQRLYPKHQLVYKSLRVKYTPENSSILVSFRYSNCEKPNLIILSPSNSTTITRLSEQSDSPNGTFDLVFNNKIYPSIPINISSNDLAELLQSSSSSDFGFVHVQRFGNCTGYSYTIEWLVNGGTKELITTNRSDVIPSRIQSGGVLFRPLPGDLTRTYRTKSQIQVSVGGYVAHCIGTTTCDFQWLSNQTPRISSVIQINNLLSINGSGFNLIPNMNRVTIGSTGICTTINATNTSLICIITSAPAGNHLIDVNIIGKGRAISNESFNATVDLQINTISPLQGKAGGGYTMNITGIGFSSASTVAIGDRLCSDPIVVDFNRITCVVPVSNLTTTTSVSVVITSNQLTAIAPILFTYDATDVPSVLSYHPIVFTVAGGLLIITGDNFGSSLATILIQNRYATVQHTNSTHIIVILPMLAPGFYSVSVLTANGYARPRLTIEYRLSVQTFFPQIGSLYGGTDIYIQGDGFDATTTVSLVENSFSIPCSIQFHQSNAIHCRTTSAAPTVTISATGIHPIYGVGFAWSPASAVVEQGAIVQWEWGLSPLLNRLAYKVRQIPEGFDSGNSTAQGSFFYQFQTVGTYLYEAPEVDPGRLISMQGVIEVIPAQSRTLTLQVRSNSFNATVTGHNQFLFTPNAVGIVTSLSPSQGPAGTIITIEGTGFSSNISENIVMIGSSYSCPIQSVSPTQIICRINWNSSLSADKAEDVLVKKFNIGFHRNAEYLQYRFQAQITGIFPFEGSIAGGTRITIDGDGFIPEKTRLIIGSINYTSSATITYTQINVVTDIAPMAYIDQMIPITIMIGDHSATCRLNACTFTWSSRITPLFTSIIPNIITGTELVTLTGKNLDPLQSSVSIGDQPCIIVSASNTTIECQINPLPTGNYPVSGSIEGVGDIVSDLMLHSSAALFNISPTIGSINGGTLLTIIGNGFPQSASNVQVLIGSRTCSIVLTLPDQIQCLVPAQGSTVSPALIRVIFNGITLRSPSNFTYNPRVTPNITSISPILGMAGQLVSIIGSNFIPNETIVTIGGISCTLVNITFSRIFCIVNSSPAGNQVALVRVSNIGLSNSNILFRYSLQVNDVSPMTGSLGGGQLISITGDGFYGSNLTVTICQQRCQSVLVLSNNILTCRTPGLSLPLVDRWCNLSVAAASSIQSLSFLYQVNLTTTVSDIHPRRGGTGGGTLLTITGTNLMKVINVSIADILCTIQSQSETMITCTTGAYSGSSIVAPVVVNLGNDGLAVGSNQFEYVDLWSSPWTWGGLPPPEEGSIVSIDNGKTVYFDTETPILKVLLIDNATLIFDDHQDVALNVEYIVIINGGRLQIGTASNPFRHRAIITMYGHLRSIELPIFGAKVLALREGIVDMHGLPSVRTWTRLAQTTNIGATQMTLLHPIDWTAGSRVVIATTGNYLSQKQSETRTIVAVSSDGLTVTLDSPLIYQHLGIVQTIGSTNVEMRAEVGLLSHNVIFRGSTDTSWTGTINACPQGFNPGEFAVQTCFLGRYGEEMGSDEFGASIMVSASDENSAGTQRVILRLSNIEITNAGQAFRLGRYPVHFHMNGNMNQSYIRSSSIHQTFNRAVNIHGSHYITIENNVIYNVMGGAVFLEDGVEIGNVFRGNLAVFVRSSSSLLNEDVTPAAFWITHPNNIVEHNAVAGGTHFGYWYRLLRIPDGLSYATYRNVCPYRNAIGRFFNNSVHSCGRFGLWIFPEYSPTVAGSCSGDNPIQAVFDRVIAWRNNRGLEWVMASSIQIRNSIVFDNQQTGIRCTTAMNHQSVNMINLRATFYQENRGSSVINSVIIGDSGTSSSSIVPSEGGLIVMWDRGLRVRNVSFINFPSPNTQAIFGPIIVGRCTSFCGGWLTKFSQLSFSNVLNRGRFRWVYDGVYHDEDGSISSIPNAFILPPDGLTNRTSGCTMTPNFINAITCPASLGRWIRFAFNQASLGRNSESLFVYNANNRFTVVLNLVKRLTHARGYMMNLLTRQTYFLHFQNANTSVNLSYVGVVYSLEPGDYLIIRHPISYLPDRVYTIDGYGLISQSSSPLSESNKNGDWYYDETTKIFSYIVRNPSSNTVAIDISIELSIVKCRYPNCVLPPQPGLELPASSRPSTALFWSNDSTWSFTNSGRKPIQDSDVFIPRNVWIVINQRLPRLRFLRIDGVLEFEQDMNNTLEVDNIFINGGQMIVGWPQNPLRSYVDIIINGSSTAEVQLPNDAGSIGARVIGVLGGLDLHGFPHNVTWTRLASTATVGEKNIHLSQPVDWVCGDEILFTTTDMRIDHVERHIVANISEDRMMITLVHPLNYTHLVIDHRFDNGQKYQVAGAVGLLTRNIRVISRSSSDNLFGFRILITDYSTKVWNPIGAEYLSTYYKGYARLSNVQMIGFGQFVNTPDEDKREGIHLLNLGTWNASRPTYVDSCVFDMGHYPAIGLWSTDGIPIKNNIIYHTYESAIIITGKDNLIQNNLISTIYWSGAAQLDSAQFNIQYDSAILSKDAISVIMRDNLVSGVDRLAYRIHGNTCPGIGMPNRLINDYDNNEAHSAMAGVSIWPTDKGIEGTNCVLLKGFKIFKTYHYGFYISTARNIIFDSVSVADANVGIFSLVIGPAAKTHQTGNNSVLIRNSLLLGSSTPEACDDWRDLNTISARFSTKAIPAVGSLGANGDPIERVAISFPYFSRDNLIPIHPFTSIAAYPSIEGVMQVTNVTMAFFNDQCSRRDLIFRLSQHNDDGQHPVMVSHLSIYNTSETNLIFNGRPNLEVVNPNDCGDMDCDGLKKGLLIDTDGSLFGQPASVFSESEYRWNDQAHGVGDFRIPRTVPRNNTPYRGILRAPTCHYQASWQMYLCPNITDYRMLIIENMDDDSEIRRISPVAVISNGYLDLLNGPQDHGWCNGYTCQRRLSTFMSIIRARKHADIYFTGTTPRHLRFRLLNSDRSILSTIGVFYNSLQQIDVYANHQYISPANRNPNASILILLDQPSTVTFNSSPGTNYFNRSSQMLVFSIRGDVVIDLKISEMIVLTFGLPAMTSTSFFQGNVLNNLAMLLGVSREKIRRVSVVAANSLGRIRRQSTDVELQIEIRDDPPMNLTDAASVQSTLNTNAAIINLYQSGELTERWRSDPELNQTVPTSLTVQEPQEQSNVNLQIISRVILLKSPSSCRERSVCDIQPVLVAYDPHGNIIDKLGSNDQPWQVVATVVNQTNLSLIGSIANYSNGQSQYRFFGVTTIGSYQFEFRFIPPSNVSSSFIVNTSLIAISSFITISPADLAAKQWKNIDVIDVDQPFNISVVLIDRISQNRISNIQWKHFNWSIATSLHPLPQYNANGSLTSLTSSSIIIDTTTGIITLTDLTIDAVGMYIIHIHVTTSNDKYSMRTNTNGILVKKHSSDLISIDSPTSYITLEMFQTSELIRASLYNYLLKIGMPIGSDLIFSSSSNKSIVVFVPKIDSSLTLKSAVSSVISSSAYTIDTVKILSITIFGRSYEIVPRSISMDSMSSSPSSSSNTNPTSLIVGLVVGLVCGTFLLIGISIFIYKQFQTHRKGRRLYNEPDCDQNE